MPPAMVTRAHPEGSEGARIVFERLYADGDSDVYSVAVDGREETLLTGSSPLPKNGFPKASPDGSRVAFMCWEYGTYLCVVDADGTNFRRLTRSSILFDQFSWSADGTSLAYVRGRRWHSALFVVDADGDNRRRLSSRSSKYGYADPAWSPDGRSLAYYSNWRWRSGLYVRGPDRDRPVRVTFPPDGYIDSAPSWAPDGTRIVFTRWREQGDQSDLYVLDLATRAVRPLVSTDTGESGARWSPDGSRIAFLRFAVPSATPAVSVHTQIFTIDPDGGNERQVTYEDSDQFRFDWSPDGRSLLYSVYEDATKDDIYVVDVDDGLRRRVTWGPDYEALPAWLVPAS